MTGERFAAARDFVFGNARLLERRLFAALFEGGSRDSVIAAVRAYQNPDGGFGEALEPDKRAPDSQPLDIACACEALDMVDAVDEEAIARACDFLFMLSGEEGGVPVVLPSIAGYARAGHWGDGRFAVGLNATARIVGYLHKHGLVHPWRDAATRYCLAELERGQVDDAHTIRDALYLLEWLSDREAAERLVPQICDTLCDARYFRADAADESYGLTPLAFAPAPDSRWRQLFDDTEVAAHLDRLERDQRVDGGWPLSWEPPSEAAVLEWRGVETLQALRVLRAYGRIDPAEATRARSSAR
jgi:hypothetical protein